MELKEQITSFLGECVKEVFTTMLKAEVKPGEPISALTQPDGFICSAGFSGMLQGSVAISLSNPGACKIVSKMSGKEMAQVSPEVTDGIGKVLNNIAQGLQPRMAKLGYDFKVAAAKMISGEELKSAVSADKMEVRLGFGLEDFDFGVSVLYKVVAEGKAEAPQSAAEQPAVTAPPESPAKEVEAPASQPAAAPTPKAQDTPAKDDAAVVASAQETTEKVPPQSAEETPAQEKKEEKPVEASASLEKKAEAETPPAQEEKSAPEPAAPLDDSPKPAETSSDPLKETTEIKSKDAAVEPSVAAQGTTDKAQEEKPGVAEPVKEEPLSAEKAPAIKSPDQAVGATVSQPAVVVVPKVKLEEIISQLDQDPKALVAKSEVKDVLAALLKTAASPQEPSDASSAAEVDAILARLDHILEKCKTLK